MSKPVKMYKPRRRRKPTAMSIAKKAYILSKQNMTDKPTYTVLAITPMNVTANVIFVEVPPTSLGDTMHYQYIDYGLKLQRDPASTTENDFYRVSLVLDRMPRDTLPLYGNIISGTGAVVTGSQNFEYRDRFKICKTWQGSFNQFNLTGRLITGRYKTRHVIEGNGNYIVGNISKNAYYFIFTTDALTNPPTIELDCTTVVNIA